MKAPTSRIGGKLDVQTPSGRSIEVFVSTQRLGGYVFWTKRRLQPATNRFAAIVLLADAEDPNVYLVPSTEWLRASPPLTDRDNVGKQSEPEYGISLARSLVSPRASAIRLGREGGKGSLSLDPQHASEIRWRVLPGR